MSGLLVSRIGVLSVHEPRPLFPVPLTFNGNPIDRNQDSTLGWRSFLASVPNGGVIQLARDIRVDQITPIGYREELDFDFRGFGYYCDSNGDGSAGDLGESKMLFRVRNSRAIKWTSTIAQGKIVGAHHDGAGNTLDYMGSREFHTAIELQSSDDCVIEKLDFQHIGGSATRWAIDEDTMQKRCKRNRMSDCNILGVGHLGVALTAIERGTVERTKFIGTGRSAIDFEPNSSRFGCFHVLLDDLDFYVGVDLNCVSGVGGSLNPNAYFGPVEDVLIRNIRAHGRALAIDIRPDTKLKDCPTMRSYDATYACRGDDAGWTGRQQRDTRIYDQMPLSRRSRIAVHGASSDDMDQTTPAMRFQRIKGLWVKDIVQPMKAGQSVLSIDDCENALVENVNGAPGNAAQWARTYSSAAPTTDGLPGGWPTWYGGDGPTFDASGAVISQFEPWELTTGAG